MAERRVKIQIKVGDQTIIQWATRVKYSGNLWKTDDGRFFTQEVKGSNSPTARFVKWNEIRFDDIKKTVNPFF